MLIRTLRPCEYQGRRVRAFACLDLPEAEGQALIDAGDAEAWAATQRTPQPVPAQQGQIAAEEH
jgi:hypothetical protein